ncbi:heat-shock protein [Cronobacter sakazakii]|nr:heat-shock protein [Cronobacter sakazakii]EGT4325664.1 heat-shock protein [Cronobacter sakazakii]EGT4364362.1 heat-shock protein [Cronobacter sakazakii]EGT5186267.1 heat-shock protein [Cronobacter sakazakii]EGT5763504.1 heat-shock protein [Cronobacter sakazakii]
MRSYSICRRRDISLKSPPFFTAWGICECLSVLTTAPPTVRSR